MAVVAPSRHGLGWTLATGRRAADEDGRGRRRWRCASLVERTAEAAVRAGLPRAGALLRQPLPPPVVAEVARAAVRLGLQLQLAAVLRAWPCETVALAELYSPHCDDSDDALGTATGDGPTSWPTSTAAVTAAMSSSAAAPAVVAVWMLGWLATDACVQSAVRTVDLTGVVLDAPALRKLQAVVSTRRGPLLHVVAEALVDSSTMHAIEVLQAGGASGNGNSNEAGNVQVRWTGFEFRSLTDDQTAHVLAHHRTLTGSGSLRMLAFTYCTLGMATRSTLLAEDASGATMVDRVRVLRVHFAPWAALGHPLWFDMLPRMPHLQAYTMSLLDIPAASEAALLDTLRRGCPELAAVRLALNRPADAVCTAALLELAAALPHLRLLDVTARSAAAGSMHPLGPNGASVGPSSAQLPGSSVGPAAPNLAVVLLSALPASLACRQYLRVLALRKCGIGPKHMADLAAALRSLPALRQLNLDENPLCGPAFAVSLAAGAGLLDALEAGLPAARAGMPPLRLLSLEGVPLNPAVLALLLQRWLAAIPLAEAVTISAASLELDTDRESIRHVLGGLAGLCPSATSPPFVLVVR